MALSILIKTTPKKFNVGDMVEIKAIFEHPMKSGQGKNKDGSPVKPHYITKAEVFYDGELINEIEMTGSVSSNPLVNFYLVIDRKEAPLKVSWVDNLGEKSENEVNLVAKG